MVVISANVPTFFLSLLAPKDCAASPMTFRSYFLAISLITLYLAGNPNKSTMESMVLGDALLEVLTDTLAALSEAASLFYGSPLPLTDTTGAPLVSKITPIQQKLNNILSTKHKIEQG